MDYITITALLVAALIVNSLLLRRRVKRLEQAVSLISLTVSVLTVKVVKALEDYGDD